MKKQKPKGKASFSIKTQSKLKASAVKRSKPKSSSVKKAKPADSIQLGTHRWPMERDVLFRPDRLKYVRKLIQDEGCVFCTAAEKEPGFETLCIKKTEHSMILINKYPYNSGHLLIVPRKHIASFQELSKSEYHDLMDLVREAAQALQDLYRPGGLNFGLNQGAVAGAGIPDHLHYHLVPRWSGDLNFFPLVAETKVVIENLETSFDRLIAYFQKKA